jgi:hypothetical protein
VPPKAAPAPPKAPTETTRTWALEELAKFFGAGNLFIIEDYLKKAGIIMPMEGAEEMPLRFVPSSRDQLNMLKGCILAFMDGEEAEKPSYANPEPSDTEKNAKKPKAVEVPRDPKPAPAAASQPEGDEEWWRHIIVPIPRKGQKRAEYLEDPDTIGSLFDLRHEQTADGQAARQRLWGFVTNYEPKGWTKTDGTVMPASESDKGFRIALDAFAEWFTKHHPDQKL